MIDEMVEGVQPVVTLTERAAKAIKDTWNSEFGDNHDYSLRIGIRGGGCAGFQYVLDFERDNPIGDHCIGEQHGVKLYVDPMSAMHLEGTILDYETSLQGMGFKFNNPSASTKCGCGMSFG